MASNISLSVIEFGSSKNFSIKVSSLSATASTNFSFHSFASSTRSAGISTISKSIPLVSSFQMIAFILIKSTTPLKSSSAPIGIVTGIGLAPNLSSICLIQPKKSAPILSILLTNPILGTLYLSACLQTVSDCGSTPLDAQNKATAPSNTRKERSTSTVKSTCPGVSIMFIL